MVPNQAHGYIVRVDSNRKHEESVYHDPRTGPHLPPVEVTANRALHSSIGGHGLYHGGCSHAYGKTSYAYEHGFRLSKGYSQRIRTNPEPLWHPALFRVVYSDACHLL